MGDKNKKILFCGIRENSIKEIENHLDDSVFIYEFCDIENTATSIKKFRPDILVTEISSIAEYKDHIPLLQSLYESEKIPFAVIVSVNAGEVYLFLINNNITGIITSPLTRNDFLNYLYKFLHMDDMLNTADSSICPASENLCSESENSLVSNLVTQNRILKTRLKKKAPYNELKKTQSDKIISDRIIENKLWEAYEKEYFRLYYQPVILLDSGKLAGFEALIRIMHPEDGLIPPDSFISVAENSAIIFPLGLWIVEEACRQIKEWKSAFLLDTPLRINVNLSANQFIHPDLTEHIFEITERYEIDENDIAFELTESAFMEDMNSANIALLELRSKKFVLYMDDFGTGYSSLTYLMHFPVNVIKIDQSFVKWMHIDEQSETLVKSLVALAHNLGLKVVAEGTDDESHIEILKNCGCDYAQGYYFAKPLPAEAAEKFISDHFKRQNES